MSDAPEVDARSTRLTEFQVINLFEEFTYRIPFRVNEHVTAIIAPNGTGKTLCLRMINALFSNKWQVFGDVIYDKVKFRFSDGATIHIRRLREISNAEESASSDPPFDVSVKPSPEAEIVHWKPRPGDKFRAPTPERYLPFITRMGAGKWRHDETGEVYNIADIVDQFGDVLPPTYRRDLYGKMPAALSQLISAIDCRLIETQRLLIFNNERQGTPYYYGASALHAPRQTLAIAKKAETLKDIVSREINNYATLSQSLDRSFPRRAIQRASEATPIDDLKSELQLIDEKRQELMDAGILDKEADQPVALPTGTLSSEIGRVMSVYAEDTRRKLASLSGILAKIKLFKTLIDQRFVTKDVKISRQKGIDVTFHGHPVPLEKLSSGEQHQLVLFFELLFEIKSNSLILIDEPELSLHVAWQKQFIGDLMKIISLNRFDVVLATHSPQLVGRWIELVVELGDVHEGERELGNATEER